MRLTLRRDDLLIAAVAFGMVALYAAVAGGGFPLDDSWIHQTYARNLAQTGQWAFIPGVPSAASTSPLYTILLAVGYKLGAPFMLWTHSLGVAALAGTGMIGARMARYGHADAAEERRRVGEEVADDGAGGTAGGDPAEPNGTGFGRRRPSPNAADPQA